MNLRLFSLFAKPSKEKACLMKLESAYGEFTVKLRQKLQYKMKPTDLYYNLGLIRLNLVEIRDALSDEKGKMC